MFRLLTAVAFLGAMAVSAYFRRRARAESGTIARRSEEGLLIAARLLVALPLFLAVVLYIAAPSLMAWARLTAIPEWTRWIGAALALASVPMVYWVLSTLGANVSETVLTKREHALVTGGPYRWVRHPLYSTGLMLFFGIGLMNQSWLVLAMSLVTMVGILTIVLPREEAHLLALFGEDYRALMRRTGRLLPRVR